MKKHLHATRQKPSGSVELPMLFDWCILCCRFFISSTRLLGGLPFALRSIVSAIGDFFSFWMFSIHGLFSFVRMSQMKPIALPTLSAPLWWHTRILGVALVGLIGATIISSVLPFAAQLHAVALSTKVTVVDGFRQFSRAKDSMSEDNTARAQLELQNANSSFTRAKTELETIHTSIRTLLGVVPFTGQKMKDGERLIVVGKELSRSALELSDIPKHFARARESKDAQRFPLFLKETSETLGRASTSLSRASMVLSELHVASIPSEYQAQFITLRGELATFAASINSASNMMLFFRETLAEHGFKRYLIVFQNDAELRPTGGFIGSFALVDIAKGLIQHIEIPSGGPYDLQGTLKRSYAAPDPLLSLNPRWEFQDANWFANFPTSARKLMWFYEASGGPTVDGVIAINAHLLPHIISLIGQVELRGGTLRLDKDTVLSEIQKETEITYNRTENKPKKIIGELFEQMMNRFSHARDDQYVALVHILLSALAARDVQLYSNDTKLQDAIVRYGWDGSLREVNGDYLMVVDANIGGAKTDAVIDASLTRTIAYQAEGSIIVTLTLTRSHHGSPGDPFTDHVNRLYSRIIVPYGSTLISARGFVPSDRVPHALPTSSRLPSDPFLEKIEGSSFKMHETGLKITREFGRTVFGGWVETLRGGLSEVSVTYRLPVSLARDLSLSYLGMAQRQSGSTIKTIKTSIEFPFLSEMTWSSSELVGSGNAYQSRTLPFDHDSILGFSFKQIKK